MSPYQAVVALGSNVGDREAYLRAACEDLAALGDIHACSPYHETPYEGKKGPHPMKMKTMVSGWSLIDFIGYLERKMK